MFCSVSIVFFQAKVCHLYKVKNIEKEQREKEEKH
jgi:hypothetical protein